MSDNPFEGTLHPTPPAKKGSWTSFLVKLVLGTVGILFVVALLLPAQRRVRPATRRAGCINNVRQMGLAILNYESATGSLPPAYTVDEDGNRLHSWRTLILPYIEEGGLYDSIDLTKPWDDPVNAEARKAVITPYLCPSAHHDETKTTYLAVVGHNTAFTGSEKRSWAEATKELGASATLAIVDVPDDLAVHWMSPYDTDIDTLDRLTVDSETNHDGIIIGCFLDNHTQSLSLENLGKFLDAVRKGEMQNFDEY